MNILRSILSFTVLAVAALGATQPATRLWIKTTSLPGTDTYQDLEFDALGNTYVCGSSLSPVAGKYAFLIAKFDRNGTKVWEKLLPGTSGHSSAVRLDVDSTGNVVVVGNTQTNPPDEGQSRIVRISPAGTILYDVAGTAAKSSGWYSVAINSLGEATATGFVDGGSGKVMRTSHFLTSGVLAWSRDYTYPGISAVDQHGIEVQVDSADNIYVCGVHNAFPNGSWNTIVKYNRTATQQWMTHVKNGFTDYPRGFLLVNDSFLAMACEVSLNGQNYVYQNFFDKNGVKQSRTCAFSYYPDRPSLRSFDCASDGTTYMACQKYDQFSQLIDSSIGISINGNPANYQYLGYSGPDFRAICRGQNVNEFYAASSLAGAGARPLTIQGRSHHIIGTNTLHLSDVWQDTIFGSTANGQTPFALAGKMRMDVNGDLFVIGSFSGSNAVDAFIVKYELGPLAEDDLAFAYLGQTITSSRSVLLNDAQYKTSQLALVQAPLHGAFTLDQEGSYTFVPDPGFAGRDRAIYRLTRQGIQTRTSEGTLELYIIPDAVSISATPSTLKGGGSVDFKGIVSAPVNYYMSCSLLSDDRYLAMPNEMVILKDRNYSTMRVLSYPVTATVTTDVKFYCGRTNKTVTVTLTP